MGNVGSKLIQLQRKLLSDEAREWGERVIVSVAIAGFLLHLFLILLVDFGFIDPQGHELLRDFNSAIYTPFSFILVYEVYLLVYHLPLSILNYIGKQYEIVALIIIRRIFKDISELELTLDWFNNSHDLQFSFDIVTILILFYLIYLFYRLVPNTTSEDEEMASEGVKLFKSIKRGLSLLLVPVVVGLACYSLFEWSLATFSSQNELAAGEVALRTLFFDDFFTVLILVDVLLLLISFFGTNDFSKVIRNSGFVISTILIKLSFSVTGLMNVALVIVGVLFGIAILWIHNQYARLELPSEF